MKKLLIILVLLFAVIYSNAQTKKRTIEATNYLILNSDSLSETTQIDSNDTIMATKQYVLNTAGTGNGWDSLTYNNEYIIWWYGGSKIDSVSRTGVNMLYSDTASLIYSQYKVDSLLNAAGVQAVYEITLPVSGTLAGSVSSAVDGTDYPTGWNLSASGANLHVGHNLSRYVADISVFYNTTGTSYRQLTDFQNAYSGVLNISNDSLSIDGISTYYTQYKLKVFLTFK